MANLQWGKWIGCALATGMLSAQALDFSAHGYFRTRYQALQNLDTQSPGTAGNDRLGLVQFNQMRLRTEPTLKLNDNLSIHTQFDVLDNVLFGTKSTEQLSIQDPIVGTITLPAGGGSLSLVGSEAGNNGSINVRRAWMDVQTPIGKLRLGRQPSHWGLGIFQNDGNGPDGDFGDTADRVLFLTQRGFKDGGALTMGALWDVAYEAQRDPRVSGLATAIRENGQDTNQWALITLYERPSFDIGLFAGFRRRNGSTGNTTTALDVNGVRQSAGIDGNTRVFFGDLYGKYRFKDHSIGAEAVYIGGKMSTGVALDAINFGQAAPGIIELPANQDVKVLLAALEADGKYDWGGEWKLQGGFAEGDGSPLSQRITQYGFRPDYQLGLLMFHHPLGTSPRMRSGSTGALLTGGVPITGNYINNAFYGALTYLHKLDVSRSIPQANEFKVGARVVTAMAHRNPVSLDFGALLGDATLPAINSRGKWYGVEADLLVRAKFYDHLHTNLELGALLPGSAFDINPTLVDPGSIIATIAPDKANLAFGGRLTVSMEF